MESKMRFTESWSSALTEGTDHLWPLHGPAVHQPVCRVPLAGGPQGEGQVQPSQVLPLQGEKKFLWGSSGAIGRPARATHRSVSFPSGPVSQFQRRLPPPAAAAHGATGGRFTREQAALRGRDHLGPHQGQQALELLQGTSQAALTCDLVTWNIMTLLCPPCTHLPPSLQVESLWQLLCPLLRTALSNITIETYADWGTCIATACVSILPSPLSVHVLDLIKAQGFSLPVCCVTQESRDPRKLHWLFEMLMESPVNGEGGSFVDAWWVESLK